MTDTDPNVCRPIDSFSELDDFIQNPPAWGTNTIKLNKRSKVIRNCDLYTEGNICHLDKLGQTPARFEYGSVPKTLICHDMANGYHDDRFIQGTDNNAAYCFYHWAAVDMFIYFSHHFITIPPLGWINTAHKHGVQILGTIITEWTEGKAICKEFLETEEKMKKLVDQIVTIAKYLKLDGWLINIENEIDNVGMLLNFVAYLTTTMHENIPGSVVIWYDSVTNDGSLSWQNCLNIKNKNFFDVCDGLFTNYVWGTSHLKESIAVAGDRKYDVYVGVDVWGRNFWGGGLFNTAEAVKEVHKVGLSLAIFAPAWTHEGIQHSLELDHAQSQRDYEDHQSRSSEPDNIGNSGDGNLLSLSKQFKQCVIREHFILRENAFWNALWPYLNTRGPTQLPFKTFFCVGSGKKKRTNGDVIENKTWFNLQLQDYQISSPICPNNHWLELERPEKPKRKLATPSEESNTETLNVTDSKRQKRTSDLMEIPKKDIENVEEIVESSDLTFDKLPANSTGCIVCPTELESNTELKDVEDTIIKSEACDLEARQYRPPIKKFRVKVNTNKSGCVEFYQEDSLEGGGCIKISPVNINNESPEISRLFVCEFSCNRNCTVYYASKKLDMEQNQDLHLILSLRNNKTDEIFSVILAGHQYVPDTLDGENVTLVLYPVNFNPRSFEMVQRNLLKNYPGFYIPVENDNGWNVRYFSLEYPNFTILNISCKLENKTGRMLLGGLGIC